MGRRHDDHADDVQPLAPRARPIPILLAGSRWRIATGGGGRDRGRAPRGRPAGRQPPDVRRSRPPTGRAEIHIHDTRALTRLLSTARPVAARPTWTACGPARTSPASCAGPPSTARRWRCRPAGSGRRPSSGGRSPTALRRNTKGQSRRNIAAHYDLGQRLLPAVPRRDDDLLERGVRLARPVARGRPAQQVPAHGRRRRPASPASTSSRSGPAGAGSPSTRRASSAAA